MHHWLARRLSNRAAGLFFITIEFIMSLLSDFKLAAHSQFQAVAGTESLTIGGGGSIGGTFNEASFSREYETGGFEQNGSMEFVTGKAAFAVVYPASPKSYEGKIATARGETWRIASVNVGETFIRISLISANKSA